MPGPTMRAALATALALAAPVGEARLADRVANAYGVRFSQSVDPNGFADTGLSIINSDSNTPAPKPLEVDTPESYENLKNYEIVQPTPPPAAFNGVYCRGGACQYRVPPPPTLPPFITPFPNIGYGLNRREFCRGLGCVNFMGWPANPLVDGFNLNCAHLFIDLGGGLKGNEASRTLLDVKESFIAVCKGRVALPEHGACPGYADVFVAALSPFVKDATVGGVKEACTNAYLFITSVTQAEIDMKLNEAALPGTGMSLLAVSLNRFGTGGVGPETKRGREWRRWVEGHHPELLNLATPPPSEREGVSYAQQSSGVQAMLNCGDAAAQLPVNGGEAPRPLVPIKQKYQSNPPCAQGYNAVPVGENRYQLVPGSPDGVVGPVEVKGNLFKYCINQMSEIMLNYAQTAPTVITMTKSWCGWQSSVTSWTDTTAEVGHPDWNHHNCNGMVLLASFALRNEMESGGGLSAPQVCTKMLLGLGNIHRVSQIVKEAWQTSLRGAPSMEASGGDDEEMKRLMQQAQKYADSLYSKLRGQKASFDAMNTAKMDVAAFDPQAAPMPGQVLMADPPPLPDSDDTPDDVPATAASSSIMAVQEAAAAALGPLQSWGRPIASDPDRQLQL